MDVRKAVITAAGRSTRHYPASSILRKELFPLVDTDGITKSVMHFIVEEVLNAGIEEICIVTSPGGDIDFRNYFKAISPDDMGAYLSKPWAVEQSAILQEMGSRISYAYQSVQDGYGHAVYCAKEFAGDEPFLLMLGDHIYLSHTEAPCSAQVIDAFRQCGKSTAGVAQTAENMIHLFGTITGHPNGHLFEVTGIKEKPSIEYAQQHLRTPGLAEGSYFCFFGIQCLTPGIFDCLDLNIRNNIRDNGEIQLTSAMDDLRKVEGFYSIPVDGERFDVGVPSGYAATQTALLERSRDRQTILQKG